jgi:hypothetical protein
MMAGAGQGPGGPLGALIGEESLSARARVGTSAYETYGRRDEGGFRRFRRPGIDLRGRQGGLSAGPARRRPGPIAPAASNRASRPPSGSVPGLRRSSPPSGPERLSVIGARAVRRHPPACPSGGSAESAIRGLLLPQAGFHISEGRMASIDDLPGLPACDAPPVATCSCVVWGSPEAI